MKLIISMTLSVLVTHSSFLSASVQKKNSETPQIKVAKNIIYFIGDGMGPAAVTAGRVWSQGSEGQLNIERLSHTGFSKTWSSSDYVTDSAASGTALASGVKTYNGSVGMSDPRFDPSKKSQPLQTLTDLAKSLGKSVGIITTARVTHATPACFYAHASSREQEEHIADQVADSKLDLLLGGGREAFINPEKGRNITSTLTQKGWTYLTTRKELLSLPATHGKPIIGLFADDHLSYDLQRSRISSDEPELKEMVAFAVSLLSKNPNGYFLMVEGGRIDHAAHENDPQNLVGDMVAFDSAIGYALDHTNQNESLIVVTADHETGGLALNGYAPRKDSRGKKLLEFVPDFSGKEQYMMTFASGPKGLLHRDSANPVKEGTKIRSLYWGEYASHTAVDVPIIAAGVSSERFTGYMSNEKIPWKIANAMGTRFTEPVNLSMHGKLNAPVPAG